MLIELTLVRAHQAQKLSSNLKNKFTTWILKIEIE
jgi:hypothetical protein